VNPLVSVIIPVYNCEKYIEKCLDSILKQTYNNIEILVINDGSTDNSLERINRYQDIHKNIHITTTDNRGVSHARNIGIEQSNGEYIVFVDADDTIESEYIMHIVFPIVEGRCDIVFSGYKHIYLAAKRIEKMSSKIDMYDNLSNTYLFFIKNSLGATILSPVMKAFKSKIVKRNCLKFDEDIKYGEDCLFNLNYYKYIKKCYIDRSTLYNYFHHNRGSAIEAYNEKRVTDELFVLHTESIWLKSCEINNWKYIINRRALDVYRSISCAIIRQSGVSFKERYDTFVNFSNRFSSYIRMLEPSSELSFKQRCVRYFLSIHIFMPIYIFYHCKYKQR